MIWAHGWTPMHGAPAWSKYYTTAQRQALLEEAVRVMATRYAHAYAWDVLNEAVCAGGLPDGHPPPDPAPGPSGWCHCYWSEVPNHVELIFRVAREAVRAAGGSAVLTLDSNPDLLLPAIDPS